jgi:hypothetical protein
MAAIKCRMQKHFKKFLPHSNQFIIKTVVPLNTIPADLTEYLKERILYFILLPVYMVATAVKAICKYRSRGFGCDSNTHSLMPRPECSSPSYSFSSYSSYSSIVYIITVHSTKMRQCHFFFEVSAALYCDILIKNLLSYHGMEVYMPQ